MSILESSIAPYLTLLVTFAVLAGFFRKMLVKVVIIIAAEVVLLALFPALLLKFIELIQAVRGLF
jgi:hypothetical protein